MLWVQIYEEIFDYRISFFVWNIFYYFLNDNLPFLVENSIILQKLIDYIFMAELKNPPSVLKTLDIINMVMGVIAVLSIGYSLLAIFNDGENAAIAMLLGITSLVSWAILSGLYYIVKAACLYLEKEGTEE